MASAHHPTKEKLIETTARLLRSKSRAELSSELILSESGISKGSLYHHFEDLDHLIEQAMLKRYTDWVDVSISSMTDLVTRAKSREDLVQILISTTKRTQDPAAKSERIHRAEVLAMAAASPRFATFLSQAQQRLTDSLTDLIREVQEIGFFNKELDPHVMAVFIQAYTLGKVVDDFSDDRMDAENWNSLINTVILKVFVAPE